jgi:hypothetical protein
MTQMVEALYYKPEDRGFDSFPTFKAASVVWGMHAGLWYP